MVKLRPTVVATLALSALLAVVPASADAGDRETMPDVSPVALPITTTYGGIPTCC